MSRLSAMTAGLRRGARRVNLGGVARVDGLAHDGGDPIFLARLDTELLAAGANDCVRHV